MVTGDCQRDDITREGLAAMSRHMQGSGRISILAALAALGAASCAGLDGGDGASATATGTPAGGDGQPVAGSAAAKGKQPPYKQGEILVRFKAGVARQRAAAVNAVHSAQVAREYDFPPNL